MKYFALLTKLGENLLAQATALGTKLELTHMAVGDGGGSLPTPDTNQTKLIAEKRRAAINTLFIDDKNKNQIIAEQIIPEQDGGWWIREIGLFDKAGNLIAVANCPETYKPQLAEGSGRTQSIRMVLIVSHTESVTLKIDPSVVLATRKYVDDSLTALDQKIILELERYVKIGDYGVGGTGVNAINNMVDVSAFWGASGTANWLAPNYAYGAGWQSTYRNNRRAQAYVSAPSLGGNGKFFSRFSLSDSLNDVETPWAEHYTTLNKPTHQALGLDEVYLRIGNPAVSAKKLTNPSRIAGHIFYGQGENISITPDDIGAQPAGDYVSNQTFNHELGKKFDVSGGTITGSVNAIGTVTANSGYVVSRKDKTILQLRTAISGKPSLVSSLDDINYRVHEMPDNSGKLMQVGDLGFGGVNAQPIGGGGYDVVSVTSVLRGSGIAGDPPLNLAYGAVLHLNREVGRATQIACWQGIMATRSQLNGNWDNWIKYYSEANTSKDRNGYIRTASDTEEMQSVPIGASILWNTSAPIPANFWPNEGRSFSANEYPELAKIFTSLRLPDDRGYGIRVADNGKGIDVGRTVGSYQEDAMQDITGSITNLASTSGDLGLTGAFSGANTKSIERAIGNAKTQYTTIELKASSVVRTANETRMKNVAKILITRVK